jgi:hypothetical protein
VFSGFATKASHCLQVGEWNLTHFHELRSTPAREAGDLMESTEQSYVAHTAASVPSIPSIPSISSISSNTSIGSDALGARNSTPTTPPITSNY